jgi:hypothetical protein
MANDTKTITVAEGVLVYTGRGAHPFRGGESVPLPADHADELVAQSMAAHAAPEPKPAEIVADRVAASRIAPEPKPSGA